MRIERFVVLLVVLFAGCATVQVQNPAELKSTHGYVQVAVAETWGDPAPALALVSTNGGTVHELKSKRSGPALMSLWLPAGDYRLPAMQGDTDLPLIHVEAGRATDLGGMRSFDIGSYKRVLVQFSHPEFNAVLKAGIDENRAFLTSDEPIKWRIDRVPKPDSTYGLGGAEKLGGVAILLMAYDRKVNEPPLSKRMAETTKVDELLALARQSAVPTRDEPSTDALGNNYFPGDFGQIRVRSVNGAWTSIDTGVLQPLTAVAIHDDIRIVGTRYGNIFYQLPPFDGQWKLAKSFADNIAVFDLDRVDDKLYALTLEMGPSQQTPVGVIQRLAAVDVHTTKVGELGMYKLLRRVDCGSVPVLLPMVGVRGEIVSGAYFANSCTDLYRFDAKTDVGAPRGPNHAVTLFSVSQQTPGLLTGMKSQGMFSTLSVSDDYGVTWREMPRPTYSVFNIHMHSRESGFAALWDANAFSVDVEFLAFSPQKNEWEKHFEIDSGACRFMVETRDHRTHLCVSRGASILRYDGSKLEPEFAAD